jgi:hypothetical protein
MRKNARKRVTRLMALSKIKPERVREVWNRRLQSKLYQIHEVAGDLTVPFGAFDIVSQEVDLLKRCLQGKQEIRNAKSILETEACRALRLNS